MGRSRWPRSLKCRTTTFAYWDCGFEFRRKHVCLSVVSVVCCQVEVCATGRSLVQGSPVECVCVSFIVIRCNNSPLQLQCEGRKVKTKKKEKKRKEGMCQIHSTRRLSQTIQLSSTHL